MIFTSILYVNTKLLRQMIEHRQGGNVCADPPTELGQCSN